MKTDYVKKGLVVGIICLLMLVTTPTTGINIIQNSKNSNLTFERENHPPTQPIMCGPIRPKVNVSYAYSFSSDDLDGNDISYYVDWGDGIVDGWTDPYPPNLYVNIAHTYYKSGQYIVTAKVKDIPWNAESDESHFLIIVPPHGKIQGTITKNHPPTPPIIRGIDIPIYHAPFYFRSFDLERDNISYYIEWDDGTSTGWPKYYPSGVEILFTHTFKHNSEYVRARAKDTHDAISKWRYWMGPKGKYFSLAGKSIISSNQDVMSIIPTVERINYVDDTTPPVTTYELNPPVPDGYNDWYVSDVNVTLNATDDISGVKEIKYQVDSGAVQTLQGDNGVFTVTTDSTMHTIKYWAIDNAGNAESQKTIQFKQDRTPPVIELTYEWSDNKIPYKFTFNTTAVDAKSGMNRVEFYNFFNGFQKTIYGPGPYYIWEIKLYPTPSNKFDVIGLISNLEISDESVRFYAVIVKISRQFEYIIFVRAYAYDNAGNWDYDDTVAPSLSVNIVPGFYLFKNLILPNNYTGYIGRYFIWATFSNP
jgi:hypothetical protein